MSREMQRTMPPRDGSEAWRVALALVPITTMVYGFSYSLSILEDDFMDEFQVSLTKVVAIINLPLVLEVIIGIPSASYADKFGVQPLAYLGIAIFAVALLMTSFATSFWTLAFSLGVLPGFSYALIGSNTLPLVSQWFDRYLGIATAISWSGSSLGWAGIPQLLEELIESYGWRKAFRICAVVFSLALVAAVPFLERRLPFASRYTFTDWGFFRTTRTRLFLLACFCCFYAIYIPSYYVYSYATSVGTSTTFATFLVSLLGISSFVFRLILCNLSDWAKDVRLVLVPVLVVSGIIFCIWPFVESNTGLICITIFLCMLSGYIGPGIQVLITNMCPDLSQVTSVSAIIWSLQAPGLVCGTYLTGILFEYQGHFIAGFWIAGIMLLLAAAELVFDIMMYPQISIVEKKTIAIDLI